MNEKINQLKYYLTTLGLAVVKKPEKYNTYYLSYKYEKPELFTMEKAKEIGKQILIQNNIETIYIVNDEDDKTIETIRR